MIGNLSMLCEVIDKLRQISIVSGEEIENDLGYR